MLKYWNQAELTAQAMNDGWMRTGDAGYISPDGLLFIVDRLKDMILSGGENIYSVEVENAIFSLDGVAQCAVIGVPDPGGRAGARRIGLAARRGNLNRGVIDHCKQLIAGYKCPRSVEFRKRISDIGRRQTAEVQVARTFWDDQARGVA